MWVLRFALFFIDCRFGEDPMVSLWVEFELAVIGADGMDKFFCVQFVKKLRKVLPTAVFYVIIRIIIAIFSTKIGKTGIENDTSAPEQGIRIY